jgi:hypothetical protein
MNFSLGGLNKVKLFINREAIDGFFCPAGRGTKRSASVCVCLRLIIFAQSF